MPDLNENAPERCDLLIRGGYVITMDADNSKHPHGAIAIRGARSSPSAPRPKSSPGSDPCAPSTPGAARSIPAT